MPLDLSKDWKWPGAGKGWIGLAPLRSAFNDRTAPDLKVFQWLSPRWTTVMPCNALGQAIM